MTRSIPRTRTLVRGSLAIGATAAAVALIVNSTGNATAGTQDAVQSDSGPAVQATATPNSMGFIGCSMAENVAEGYVANGGTRMWGPYGTGGLVVQSWTDTNSSSWQKFDQQASEFGEPTTVWVQICIFADAGATYDEVKQLIANAREHAAPDAEIIITGQPLYPEGNVCSLAGADGPQLTDDLAKQAAADTTQDVTYPGAFQLKNSEVADGCHANTAGQESLGKQALEFWG